MYTALISLHIVVSILMILVVLMQAGRGAELGAAFGSMGQATFGRGQTTFMAKLTRGLAVVFMSTSLGLAFYTNEAVTSSVVSPSSTQNTSAPMVEAKPDAVEQKTVPESTSPVTPAPMLPQAPAPAE
ncbi:MAG: preprotein translocase subunit SecG [Deltaproteobacteria bacterium]|nr:preprotein translocase subunit SecG [Deltaproteobacteria bacterium]